MSKTIIFDTEATGIKEPVLIEAAWVELESIEPLLPLILVSLASPAIKPDKRALFTYMHTIATYQQNNLGGIWLTIEFLVQ